MKLKIELDVPDFPEQPAHLEASRLSTLLGTVGSTEIMEALLQPNMSFFVKEPTTGKPAGSFHVDGRASFADEAPKKEEPSPHEDKTAKAIGDFFANKNWQGNK